MKTKILAILRKSQGYVSGQQLCEVLHVSRTAVWKVIEQLKEEGYEIEAIRNKGYRLCGSPDILSSAELESLAETNWAGKKVFYFDVTDSTNTRAKKLGEEGHPHGTVVAADRQTGGKGRRGCFWESPSGKNMYTSILLRPRFAPSKAPMLTLVMALGAAEAVQEMTDLDVRIKWPNDLVVNGKKICGILTEMSAEVDYINHVVIGIGINTNISDFPEELRSKATSLFLETGVTWRRAELIASVMRHFEANYEIFLQTENLSKLTEQYNHMLINKDRQVQIIETGSSWMGRASGINETGELQVEKEDGTIENVFAGEVSVRGVCGYV